MKIHVLNEQFFAEVVVRDEVGTLRSIYRAIPKWEQVALAETEADRQLPGNVTGLEAEWHDQHLQGQYSTLDATKSALLAGLAVSASAAMERTMLMLCRDRGERLRDRAGWGEARPVLERLIRANLSTLNGFTAANRVRLLGNCFKHNAGRRNREFVDNLWDGAVGEEIRYENEDWPALIDGIQSYLTELAAGVWR